MVHNLETKTKIGIVKGSKYSAAKPRQDGRRMLTQRSPMVIVATSQDVIERIGQKSVKHTTVGQEIDVGPESSHDEHLKIGVVPHPFWCCIAYGMNQEDLALSPSYYWTDRVQNTTFATHEEQEVGVVCSYSVSGGYTS